MTLGKVMKEKDEEIALFLEMRRNENERSNHLLLYNSDVFDASLGSKPESSPTFKIVSSPHALKTAAEHFLNSDEDKNDYDWLLTPPGTPLFPSLEMESQKTVMSQIGTPKALTTALKSKLSNPQLEPSSRENSTSRQPVLSPGLKSSCAGIHRPSSSGGTGSIAPRSATPTGRPTLPAAVKPVRTSASTSMANLPSSKSMGCPARSTPSARSSTPKTRPTVPASKASSRSGTPTRRPSIPSSISGVSAPPTRSSSATKLRPATTRNPMPSRSNSSVKSRPNLRTSMPERPVSASRSRPGAPNSRSSSVEAYSNRKLNRQSCFPSSGQAPNGNVHSNGSLISAVSRAHLNGSDDVNPVLMGTEMVERIINMRKLAPPKHTHSNPTEKSSSQDSSGFGRTLSKKSLDMALRHMDITRSMPSNRRPLTTNIPASSMYSVRSGQTRIRTVSVSDSPLATSSNASSELSSNNNTTICLNGSEVEEDDDLGSERKGHPFL